MAQDLWQIRRQKRMTIDELARRAGIHPGLIKAYELGERAIPERDLEKLAKALLIETWDIKEMSDPPPRGPSRPETPAGFGSESSPPPAQPSRPRYESNQGFSRYNTEFTRPNYDPEPPRRPSYDQDRRSGGYDQDRRSSGYDQDRRSGGYDQDRRTGGYDSDRRGGYGSESRRPSYDQDRRSGSGGYGSESRSRYGGDYSRPSYDQDRRPSGGYGSDQGGDRGGPRGPYKTDRRDQRPRKKEPGVRRRPQASPARPSQIEHLKMLLTRLDVSGDDLLRLAGKPLSMLNRKEAAQLLTTCQNMLAEQKPARPKGKRQRPYLPESVDEHELVYLTEVQLSKRNMDLTLFNGQTMQGKLLGFSPYALTIAAPDGQEVTLQKLAIAYYQVEPAAEAEPDDEDE